MCVLDSHDAFVDKLGANQTHRHPDPGIGAGADLVEIADCWMHVVGTEDRGLTQGMGEA